MKKLMTIMLGLSLLTGVVAFAEEGKTDEKKSKKAKKKAAEKKADKR